MVLRRCGILLVFEQLFERSALFRSRFESEAQALDALNRCKRAIVNQPLDARVACVSKLHLSMVDKRRIQTILPLREGHRTEGQKQYELGNPVTSRHPFHALYCHESSKRNGTGRNRLTGFQDETNLPN
jgi:hypothetical protein